MEKKQFTIITTWKQLLFVAFLFGTFACTSKDKAKISINLPDLKDQKMKIEEQRVSGAKILGNEELNSRGKTSYQFSLEQPTFYNLRFDDSKDIFLMLHPTDKVQISGSKENPVITGSPESVRLNLLYDTLYAVRDDLSDLKNQYEATNEIAKKEEIYTIYTKTIQNHHRFTLKFILEDLSSMVSLAAVYQELGPNEYVFTSNRDLQYFKLVSDSLSKYYPKHRHVLALKRNFNKMMDSYNLEKLVASTGNIEATSLPELILPNTKGDSISLLSTKKNIVLLNFWTPFAENTQKYIPSLKNVHDKYGSKGFDIYNVFIGKSMDNWEKAIRFEDIEKWINVADTSFPFSGTKGKYNVTALPSNYLIDIKNKEILAKDIAPELLGKTLSNKLR